jgi:hypothetical protein
MMSWESDSPIVPMTSGNAERGKGATYYRSY